jgi:hypothetical protein
MIRINMRKHLTEPLSYSLSWQRPASRGGYTWSDVANPRLVRAPDTIDVPYDPFRTDQGGLFLRFAALKGRGACLEFANAHGHLGLRYRSPLEGGADPGALETYSEWRREGKRLADVVTLWEKLKQLERHGRRGLADRWKVLDACITARLHRCGVRPSLSHDLEDLHGQDGPPPARLGVSFRSLLGAMWWQLALAVQVDADIRPCEMCRNSMLVAGGRRAGAKRQDCRVCSDVCRVRLNRKHRGLAKQLRGQGLAPKAIAAQLDVDLNLIKKWLLTKGK